MGKFTQSERFGGDAVIRLWHNYPSGSTLQAARLNRVVGPLGLPRHSGSILRDAERELMALRIGVHPCLLPSMVRLTHRVIALKKTIESHGIPVIEGFPGSARDALGIPRKKADLVGLEGTIITPCRTRGQVRLEPYSRLAENYLAFRWGLRNHPAGVPLKPVPAKTNKAFFASLDALARAAGFELDPVIDRGDGDRNR